MRLIVKSRDLTWKGQRLVQGASFETTSDRDEPLARLLVKIGKAELAPHAVGPIGAVASVTAPEPPPAPAEVRAPEVAPLAPPPEARRSYRRRDLTAGA